MWVVRDRRFVRRGAAAALVCALTLGGSGCGDQGKDVSPVAAKTTPRGKVVVEKVEKRLPIPFASRTRRTAKLEKGARQVAQRGRDGVRLKVWRVTTTKKGETVSRELLRTEILRKPVPRITLVGTRVASRPAAGTCNLSYSPCVPSASDVDCSGGSGDGPSYVAGPVRVLGSDPYDLDSDGDGWGCD